MKRLLIAGALLAAVVAPAQAEMLYPKRFQHDFNFQGNWSYFNCDYTTHTCERGAMMFGHRVFELLDGDNQRTVLGHYSCIQTSFKFAKCFSYDTGAYSEMINGNWQAGEVVNARDCYAAAFERFGSTRCP